MEIPRYIPPLQVETADMRPACMVCFQSTNNMLALFKFSTVPANYTFSPIHTIGEFNTHLLELVYDKLLYLVGSLPSTSNDLGNKRPSANVALAVGS